MLKPLSRRAAGAVYRLLLPTIQHWERRQIHRFAKGGESCAPIFIVGAPRTGSTALYQMLTNRFDLLYIDNLVCRFFQTPFFGFLLSHTIFSDKPHNCFQSFHGDTGACGWHAPSECGAYWYRWLPKERHFIDYPDITDIMTASIRNEITALCNRFGKPIIFKNLNAGQRLRLIHRCFPSAKIIFIKRDPLYVAQSILLAKRRLGLRENDFWSIMPRNVDSLKKLGPYEQIVKQIYYVEKQIETDRGLFAEENFLTVHYKEMEDKELIVEKIADFLKAKRRKAFFNENIHVENKIILDPEEITKIEKEIDKLDWEHYCD